MSYKISSVNHSQNVNRIENAVEVLKDIYDRFSEGDVVELQNNQKKFRTSNRLVLTSKYFTQSRILCDEYS